MTQGAALDVRSAAFKKKEEEDKLSKRRPDTEAKRREGHDDDSMFVFALPRDGKRSL